MDFAIAPVIFDEAMPFVEANGIMPILIGFDQYHVRIFPARGGYEVFYQTPAQATLASMRGDGYTYNAPYPGVFRQQPTRAD